MDNKHVGLLIFGISLLLVVIIFIFNQALHDIVSTSCSMAGHGDACPMYDTITQQTYFALGIVGLLLIIGLVIMRTKPQEKIVVKKILEKKKSKPIDLSDLRGEDKKVFTIIRENGAVFQADLIEKTGFGKAKMSRIIDRLEGRGLVERKRRGMTNVVVVKED
jgi:hypothetical protein